MRKLLVVVAALTLAAVFAPTAQATHTGIPDGDDTYWSTEGCAPMIGSYCDQDDDLIVGLDNDMSWTSNMRAAIQDVMTEINSAHAADNGTGPTAPFLVRGPWSLTGSGTQGTEDNDQTWPNLCNNDSHIVLSLYNGTNVWSTQHNGWIGGSASFATPGTCGINASSQIYRVNILLADYQDGDGDQWDERGYWGATIPEPYDRVGERGILTHEFIHALGLAEHWEGRYHRDTDPTPYCQTDYDILPSGDLNPAPGTYKTLCEGSYITSHNTSGFASATQTLENYESTLTTKDEDLINMYYELIDG